MADYLELLRKRDELYSTAPSRVQEQDDFVLDPEVTLKKDDLKQSQFLNPIRDYMIERKGVDYKTIDADEVVEDFVDHMRYFNANTVSLSLIHI